jgi:hypothetical protein
VVTTLLSEEDISPVALMAKLEKSTSVMRGSPKRSLKAVAAKVMGDVVLGFAVVRDTSDSGAKTPGLEASELTTKFDESMERTTLPSKSNAWISRFSESPTSTRPLVSSTKIAVGVHLVRVEGQVIKVLQSSPLLQLSTFGSSSSWRSIRSVAFSLRLDAILGVGPTSKATGMMPLSTEVSQSLCGRG